MVFSRESDRMRLLLRPLALLLPLLLPGETSPPAACTREAGLLLPDGFCAVVVGDHLGRIRQLTVAPNGDVFVALASGGVTALRDADGDGRAEVRKTFGDEGGTGILLGGGYLWLGAPGRILRWTWAPGQLEPTGAAEVVVEGLPTDGHGAKSIALLGGDTLIVNLGSETNSCQRVDRSYRSAGFDPCAELERRAGLWRFSATRLHQKQRDGRRYATGLRNTIALAVDPGSGRLYGAPHGRDQLGSNWGFNDAQNAELPAEEFLQINNGDDFGWPYCYFDQQQGKRVLAPEYGGDGRSTDRCTTPRRPLLGFPGHWAPMAIAFYTGTQFPARFRGGAFVAFHGSWNRAPLPQEGYRVSFVPFQNGTPTGQYETFATGQGGATSLRASGVAVGPDGSLYIAGENSGTVWRVMVAR